MHVIPKLFIGTHDGNGEPTEAVVVTARDNEGEEGVEGVVGFFPLETKDFLWVR